MSSSKTATAAARSDSVVSTESAASTASKMKKALDQKVTDGGKTKSVWQMTKETFGMADGEHKGGDVYVETLEEGLEILNAHVAEMDRQLQEKQDDEQGDPLFQSWMNLVPLTEFQSTQSTQDHFLTAFLKWATKDPSEESTKKAKKKAGETPKGNINVTKAIRRLDAYFDWMKDNMAENLKEAPLTWDSIQKAAKIWDIQITYDNDQRFVWWIDIGALETDSIRSLEPQEHLRYVVWFAHLVMMDDKAQSNGAMIVENLGKIGFWKLATLVPMDLGAKLDRLTIGILPVKMKAIYVFGAATWMHILMGMMKPFMGKKMRERMVVVSDKKTSMQQFCDDLVSRANIPEGFCGLEGEAKRDAFHDAFTK